MEDKIKLKVVTLCSGYDAQCLALERLKSVYPDFDYELVSWAEIDKYAIQAHNALFPQYSDRNMGDITSCDWSRTPSPIDLLTYSTPCQSISSAGKQEGLKRDSGTASSIIWSVLNAIDMLRPRYLLMENVKALVSKKFIGDFHEWQLELERRGYSNYAKVLNSRDYGVPQNRERIFMVSILGDDERFYFPEPFPLERRLKDVLEKEVNEKYYLSKKMVAYFNSLGGKDGTFVRGKGVDDGNGIAATCTANFYKMPGTAIFIKEPIACDMKGRKVYGSKHVNNLIESGKIPSDEVAFLDGYNQAVHTDVSATIKANIDKENLMFVSIPQCLTPKRTEYGKQVRKEYESGELKESRHNMQQLEPRTDGVCNTITSVQKDCLILEPCKKRDCNILVGHKYGRLTVIEKTDIRQGTNVIYKCKCDCGNIVNVSSGHLGIDTFSCGCLNKEHHTTHGMSKSRLYNIWKLMKRRCNNANCKKYKYYGGRGISICDEWNKSFKSFYDWSILNGYNDSLTIDRINNDGNYEPLNCRWVDIITQVNNRRVWGEIPYYGIVKDNTGYRAQVTVNGKKIYIGHSKNDIKFLIEMRNKYIDEHNLKCKKNIIPVDCHIPMVETNTGGNLEPKIIIGSAQKNAYIGSVEGVSPCINAACGMGGGQTPMILGITVNPNRVREYGDGKIHDDVSMCITSQEAKNTSFVYQNDFRIRKLTERECFRLQGVDDADIDKIQAAGISRSQQYKMAGNSITLDVLFHIFRKLFIDKQTEDKQLTLF